MTPEQKSALESAIAHFERNGFWEAAELRGILDEEACRTVSGQEAVAVVGPRIGDVMANPIRWTDMKAMDSLPIGTKLYATPIPATEQEKS